MHTTPPTASPLDASGRTSPILIVGQEQVACREPKELARVGEERHSHCQQIALMNRVGRVLADMSAGRMVSDQDLRQHALDVAYLSELAYHRFQAAGIPADREEAVLWQSRQAEALRSLSPEWKAAREAQEKEQGCYFCEQGARGRESWEGRA